MESGLRAKPLRIEFPPLLRVCRLPEQYRSTLRRASRGNARRACEIVNALLDLAIATVAIRRSCRVGSDHAARFGYFYHYTGIKTFNALFPVESTGKVPAEAYPRLILSPTEILNDPHEGEHFFENLEHCEDIKPLVNGVIKHRRTLRFEHGFTQDQPLVFTASLCIEDDNLNLWRFYGDARGVSFGIHHAHFDVSSEEGIDDNHDSDKDKLYFVRYGNLAVSTAVNHILPALLRISTLYEDPAYAPYREHVHRAVANLLNTVAYLFKTDSYSAERECRLLRILSVADIRSGDGIHARSTRTIGGYPRVLSHVELVHRSEPGQPIITLGPQFDSENPQRGHMSAMDRVTAPLRDRYPIVKLSRTKFRDK